MPFLDRIAMSNKMMALPKLLEPYQRGHVMLAL
jgi:hypothetical protein